MASNERYSFKNLESWRLAQEFATEACTFADSLPTRRSADIVAHPLIRSATSISANISEGHGRFTFGAYRNHLSLARGSLAESENRIDLLVRLRHITPEAAAALEKHCITLMGALTRRMNSLENQAKQAGVRENGPTYSVDGAPVDEEPIAPLFSGSIVPDPGEGPP